MGKALTLADLPTSWRQAAQKQISEQDAARKQWERQYLLKNQPLVADKTTQNAVPEGMVVLMAQATSFAPTRDFDSKGEALLYDHLDSLKKQKLIHDFWWPAPKLPIEGGMTYQPDFLVMQCNGTLKFIEYKQRKKHKKVNGEKVPVEGKGHWRDDARVKFKSARGRYYFAQFVAVHYDARTGEWAEEQV
jgi:hypothetical protein